MTTPTGRDPDPYTQAGLVYGVMGAVILLLTVATPEMVRPERRADIAHLVVGMPFFALFALAIALGDRWVARVLMASGRAPERALRLGRWFREKLVILISLSALGRTFVFAANGLGYRPHFQGSLFRVTFEASAPDPRLLFAALLMATIFVFLVRAAWLPFCSRLIGRGTPA